MIKLEKKEDKLPPVKQLWSHPVFDEIDPHFIRQIVHEFQGIETLNKVHDELKNNMTTPHSASRQRVPPNTDEKRKRAHTYLIREMLREVPLNYKLEINLVYFLTLTPAGLSLTDVC
jgi:hypothetical protein